MSGSISQIVRRWTSGYGTNEPAVTPAPNPTTQSGDVERGRDNRRQRADAALCRLRAKQRDEEQAESERTDDSGHRVRGVQPGDDVGRIAVLVRCRRERERKARTPETRRR